MNEKPKPCLFCNSGDLQDVFRWPGKLIVRCNNCGAEGPTNYCDWNNRPTEKAAREEVLDLAEHFIGAMIGPKGTKKFRQIFEERFGE